MKAQAEDQTEQLYMLQKELEQAKAQMVRAYTYGLNISYWISLPIVYFIPEYPY
jgi:hypothetical protein